MYDLDSHFWDRAKQTWREAKDRHKHTVPQALSLMGGQSTLVRLPAPTYVPISYTHTLRLPEEGSFCCSTKSGGG